MSAPKSKRPVLIVMVLTLLIMGAVVLCLFKLPLQLRLLAASADLIAAAVLFVAFRQQNSD